MINFIFKKIPNLIVLRNKINLKVVITRVIKVREKIKGNFLWCKMKLNLKIEKKDKKLKINKINIF